MTLPNNFLRCVEVTIFICDLGYENSVILNSTGPSISDLESLFSKNFRKNQHILLVIAMIVLTQWTVICDLEVALLL